LLVTVLSIVALFFPFAELINVTQNLSYMLSFKGIYLLQPNTELLQSNVYILSALSVVIPLIALAAIFLYKKRKLQIQIIWVNIFLMIGFYAALIAYLLIAANRFQTTWNLAFATAFHLVNIILSLLAIRGIKKDQELVRSLNRLR
jgi:hypothetical protein